MARVILMLALALAACEKNMNQGAFGPRGSALPPPGLQEQ
jgi:hypothetical protein